MGSCIYDRMEECSHDCENCANCIKYECRTCGECLPWSDMERNDLGEWYCPDCFEEWCKEYYAEFEDEDEEESA